MNVPLLGWLAAESELLLGNGNGTGIPGETKRMELARANHASICLNHSSNHFNSAQDVCWLIITGAILANTLGIFMDFRHVNIHMNQPVDVAGFEQLTDAHRHHWL